MVKASGTAPESQRKSGQPSYSNFVKRMMPASYRLATIGSGVCGAAPPLITLPRLGRLSAPFSSSDYRKCSPSVPTASWPLRLTCRPNRKSVSHPRCWRLGRTAQTIIRTFGRGHLDKEEDNGGGNQSGPFQRFSPPSYWR